MKTRKQYETFTGDNYTIEYTLLRTDWAGDNETPPAIDWEMEDAILINEHGQRFELPWEFIERFNINDKLISYDY